MRVDYNFEGFKKEFQVSSDATKKNKLIHSTGKGKGKPKIRILPYSTKKKSNIVENYQALIGNFSRILGGYKPRKFDQEQYIKTITNKVDSNKKNILTELIKELFFEQEELILTHPIFFNYLPKGKVEKDIAHFLAAIFYSKEIRDGIRNAYAKKPNNVLLSLLYESLDELEKDEDNIVMDNFKCLVPSLKEQFEDDFLFLLSNEELLIRYFLKIIVFYYFIYVTQLILKLDWDAKFRERSFELDPIYFFLDWEKRSKSREYIRCWQGIERKSKKLFAHINCISMINYITDKKNKYDYLTYNRLKALVKELSVEEKECLAKRIAELNRIYKSCINDVDWSTIKHSTSNDPLENVKMLLESISYQFKHSVRKKPADEYSSGYVDLAKKHFLKKSGPLSFTLNLTQDDLIFLTKLCLKDKAKMSRKNLFVEMEKRGVFFDRMTQKQVVSFYEKLNLLEKKSDSGDAQYVRNIR